jgi:long-chain acyl-CoA synthetase
MSDRIARLLAAGPAVGDHRGADLGKAVDRVADRLLSAGVGAGERVGLRGTNRPEWLLSLLALLHVGAHPLLLPHDSPEPEVARLLAAAGAARCLVSDDVDDLAWLGAPDAEARPAEEYGPAAVLVATSGSTGAPKVVARTVQSLVDEGMRYVNAGLATGTDTLAVPLPLTHAYALGWVFGGLLAGARILPLPPRALRLTEQTLAEGATVLTVVPDLSRVLLRRLGATVQAPALRLVMAGAGYVDAELDARWAAAAGVGLARNYGSTETGAVMYGPAGLPSGFVGRAMPGVHLRLVPEGGEADDGDTGEVVVTLEHGSTHAMGDLARRDGNGWVQIIGRRATSAVRRGGRWVSTLEVRSVLAEAYGVADVSVTGPADPGDDETLTAEYVPAGAAVTVAALADFARANLSPHKVPNAFVPRHRITRDPLGKTPRPPRYRLTSTEVAAEAVAAYRRTELLLAIAEVGGLDGLAAGRTAPELAAELGLDAGTVADLLAAAHDLGLVTTAGGGPVDTHRVTELIDAESDLRTVLTAAGLAAASRSAAAPARPADRTRGADHVARVRRLADLRPDDRAVQFGAGPADYAPLRPLDAAPESLDVCFVADAVHGPGRTADLDWLAGRLRVGGRLVVEDRFLDGPGPVDGSLSLAWLATGSRSWWNLADLQSGLESVGLEPASAVSLADPYRVVLLARRGAR